VFTDRILDRFDIVGVDPRGVGASENLRCWPNVKEQTAVLSKLNQWFPYGPAEEELLRRCAAAGPECCVSRTVKATRTPRPWFTGAGRPPAL
jgi:hypothetical protein